MSLPSRTTVLIVGAGPTGLACAISLISEGCRDIVVVDAVLHGENTSRAMVIHAATLEALDTLGCADPLIDLGIKAPELSLHDRLSSTSPLVSADFTSLAPYTRHPYALLLPQSLTEQVLGEKLRSFGVNVFRPCRVTGMKRNDHEPSTVDMSFDNGEVVQASYIIGADGARSSIRQLAGIGFKDPGGDIEENSSAFRSMVLADVIFDTIPSPPLPSNTVMGFVSPENFFLVVPLPAPWVSASVSERNNDGRSNIVYRIGCGIPARFGNVPRAPPTSYLQALVDTYGPTQLSSDPTLNSNPVQISETIWSTRFRTHAAIAERFFTRFVGEGEGDPTIGAVVFLIGDAAHIHSPAGGQGMNLGLRDAIGLGPVLSAHAKTAQSSPLLSTSTDKVIQDYATSRYARALTTIRLTKGILWLATSASGQSQNMGKFRNWLLRFLGGFSVVRNFAAWKLSGLGSR